MATKTRTPYKPELTFDIFGSVYADGIIYAEQKDPNTVWVSRLTKFSPIREQDKTNAVVKVLTREGYREAAEQPHAGCVVYVKAGK